MRYAVDWCLFDFLKHENQSAANQCTSSCTKISNALEINILAPNATTTYDYCEDLAFLPNVEGCAACYQVIPDQLYLSNCKPSWFIGCIILILGSSESSRIRLSNTAVAHVAFLNQAFRYLHLAAPIKLLRPPW